MKPILHMLLVPFYFAIGLMIFRQDVPALQTQLSLKV